MAIWELIVPTAALLVMVTFVVGEPQGPQYLPPDQGYNYPKPTVPFPSPTPPRVTRPPPTYQPPPTFPPSPPSRPPTRPPPPPPTRPPPTYPRPPPPTYPPSRPPNTGDTILPNFGTRPPPPRPTPTPGGGDHHHDHDHHEPGMPYDFNYAVKDDYYGTDYSRNEISDGDVVRGEYRVLLPDGRTQIVRYTADWKTGFHADVTYEGEARYPDAAPGFQYRPSGSGPAPAYGPPAPSY